jgi:CHASE3 domain sensor protein
LDLTCGVVISSALSPLFNEVTWLVFGSNHVGYRGLALPTFLVLTLPAPLLLLRLNSPVGPTHRADFQVMAVALGMLLPLGVTFVRSNAQLADINREQRRSFDTCAAISYLVSENARMESSARAYALTGEDSFLARHPYHRSEIMATLAKLPELTAGDPVQQDRVNRLHVLLGWRQAEYVSLEEARRSGGAESAARYLTNLPVSRKLAFVNLADGMLALERQRMVERTGAAIDLEHSTKTEQLLSGLLGLILLGTAVGSARRSETQLKRLESFLPICSYCKKIRNDGKYWEQIEAYFSERQGTRFTHGICPECYKREVMPELRSIGEQPAGPKNPEKHG